MKSKLLYIHMDFYEYESRIIESLERKGFEVTTFYDKNYRSIVSRTIQRIYPKSRYTKRINEKYQSDFIETLKRNGEQFDIILVIVGRFLTSKFLRELRTMNSDARFILYLWDDLSRVPKFNQHKEFYDSVFSIDKRDCSDYGFDFLPLFYTNDFIYDSESKDYILFAAGLDHSNRVEMIEDIIDSAGSMSDQMKFYVYSSPFIQMKRRLGRKDFFSKRPSYIHYKRLPLEYAANYTKHSKCLLDVQYKEQNGLSIRSIESLAAHSKILTTNSNIKEYDFFNEENIMVFDRNSPIIIDYDFLLAPYVSLDDAIIEKYSIDNWCSTLLD